MAEQTGIQWCDATFNPWVGCEKVSPGCAHCYAETLVTGRMARAGTWGKDGVRERTSEANWRKPLRWARLAREGRLPNGKPNPDGHRPRVFCASLADVFEDRPELDAWRLDLFALIAQTPELDWLVLTKRPDYARQWLGDETHIDLAMARLRAKNEALGSLFDDLAPWPLPNVWLGVSIENARHTWRADVLREIPAAVRFISAEPLLGSLYPSEDAWSPRSSSAAPPSTSRSSTPSSPQQPSSPGARTTDRSAPSKARSATATASSAATSSNGSSSSPGATSSRAPLDLRGIDWIIVGGESGSGARPFHLEHAREIIRAAHAEANGRWHRRPTSASFDDEPGPAVFVKQLGAKPMRLDGEAGRDLRVPLRDRKGGTIEEWPSDLRIREFPSSGAR